MQEFWTINSISPFMTQTTKGFWGLWNRRLGKSWWWKGTKMTMKHGGLDFYTSLYYICMHTCPCTYELPNGCWISWTNKKKEHPLEGGTVFHSPLPRESFFQNWGQKILFIFTHHSQGMLRKRIFELYGHFEWFPMVEANQKITQINNSQEINHYQPLHVWILTPNWYQNCRVNCCHPMTGQHLFEWQLVTTGTRICQEIRINI